MAEITWENKREMIVLMNQAIDKESREKMLDFVITNMDDFDEQAWDMFFTGVELIKDNMLENKERYAKIQEKAKSLQSNSYVTALRMALYETIINDICH